MRLNQVTVRVKDLAVSVAFYRALGLRQIVDTPHYARFVCPDGDSTFSMELAEQAEPGTTTIYFECDDLDATISRLKAIGVAFIKGPIDQPWLWKEAYLVDPDGHSICLFHAGENRINPPWRINNDE